MTKLLAAYAASTNSLANAAIRVGNYIRKHPISVECMLSFEDQQVLDNALRHIKSMENA